MLIGVKIRKHFYEKVIKLVDIGAPNLLGHFKNLVLEACGEVCGMIGGGDVKEIHGGRIKRRWRQYHGRRMHIMQCVRIVLRKITGRINQRK